MTHPADNQYQYGVVYNLNGQIVGFNLSPDVYISLTDGEIEKVLEAYAKQKHEQEQKTFLEFLMNIINPNEMEKYLAMYHGKEETNDRL